MISSSIRRSHSALVLAIALGIALSSGRAAGAADGVDRSEALAEQAVRSNPSLAAIATRVEALHQHVRQAGSWMDPKLAVEYSSVPVDSWALGDHPMSGVQLRLEQTFTFPGKTALREEVARGGVREQRLLLAERELQLRAAVKRAYYSLALVRQLRKVTEEHVKLVEHLVDVVRVKYEVGKVGQHELLRLTVLKGKLQDDLAGFDRDDRALTATINAALHRPVGVAVATPSRIAESELRQTVEQLTAEARGARPLLRLYAERARTQRAAARQAVREGYPDLTAWVGYRVRTRAGADPGTDFFSAGIAVPLPLFYGRRFGSQHRARQAEARAAEQEQAAELDRIRGALGEQVAAWSRAAQEARTYREALMPQAHRTLDATFAAYQVDRADFASLFQAEIQLLEFERTIRRAEATAAMARVAVEALVGRSLRKATGR